MSKLFESIESPVLTDVSVSFEGVKVADVYPERPPDLFSRQPLMIYGRITSGHIGKVHLSGNEGDRHYESVLSFDSAASSFHPAITTLWARQRVEELMDQWRKSDEKGQAELRSTIVAHAIRYRLVTRFTSLVAVEEVIANPGAQSNTVAVPTELPHGWQMDQVFGAPATGTADEFLEALGMILVCAGAMALYFTRRKRSGALA